MNAVAVIDYWSSVRDIVDKTCADYDALWQKRNRILNTKIILIMIFKITACKRQYGLSSKLTEFWDICAEKK